MGCRSEVNQLTPVLPRPHCVLQLLDAGQMDLLPTSLAREGSVKSSTASSVRGEEGDFPHHGRDVVQLTAVFSSESRSPTHPFHLAPGHALLPRPHTPPAGSSLQPVDGQPPSLFQPPRRKWAEQRRPASALWSQSSPSGSRRWAEHWLQGRQQNNSGIFFKK